MGIRTFIGVFDFIIRVMGSTWKQTWNLGPKLPWSLSVKYKIGFRILQNRKVRLAWTMLQSLLRVLPILRFGFTFLKLLPPWPRAVHPFVKQCTSRDTSGNIQKTPVVLFPLVSLAENPIACPSSFLKYSHQSCLCLQLFSNEMPEKSFKDPGDSNIPVHHYAYYPSRYEVSVVKPGF